MGVKGKTSLYFLSINIMISKSGTKFIRFVGINKDSMYIRTLEEWLEYINGKYLGECISFPENTYIDFSNSNNVDLYYVDCYPDECTTVGKLLSEIGLSEDALRVCNMLDANRHKADTLPIRAKVSNLQSSALRGSLRLLLHKYKPEGTIGYKNTELVLDSDSAYRVIYLNEVSCAYMTDNMFSRLSNGVVSYYSEGNSKFLKISDTRECKLLCEGKSRHIPVIVGAEFTVNLSTRSCRYYNGVLTDDIFRSVDREFNVALFQWVTSSRVEYTGICGIKSC